MTVGTKIAQTIANCESVLANLHSFALDSQDQNAKQMFKNLAQQQQMILESLKARQAYVESEEPQYKQ
ncbi:DUF1657 domain-containing protein [Caldibacillus debilis]|uniref:DUF1657 domain-containing protein n=1 Tax=Caldibacillus debilis TaxID=301148 RepID=A0A150M7F3_9BACI|nr:DUF1657 domain-containing protein [Caldibacillus debilis]KYD20524.1 hypothetical protein B4135_1825 [Caldibacillus debilis]